MTVKSTRKQKGKLNYRYFNLAINIDMQHLFVFFAVDFDE